jgi:hypothetical protein
MKTTEQYALKFNWKDTDHLDHTKFIEEIQSDAFNEGITVALDCAAENAIEIGDSNNYIVQAMEEYGNQRFNEGVSQALDWAVENAEIGYPYYSEIGNAFVNKKSILRGREILIKK